MVPFRHLLLEGDQQSNGDGLLLEGDVQSNGDKLAIGIAPAVVGDIAASASVAGGSYIGRFIHAAIAASVLVSAGMEYRQNPAIEGAVSGSASVAAEFSFQQNPSIE